MSASDTDNIGRTPVSVIGEMLGRLDAAALSRDEWLHVGMALNEGGYDFSLWDAWSARDRERYSPGVCRTSWDGFAAGGGITMGTFFHICAAHGVERPRGSRPEEPVANAATVETPYIPGGDSAAINAHAALIERARAFLLTDPDARAAAEDYLRSNVGIDVERACELGLGALTPRMAKDAGVAPRPYACSGLWLAFPSRGDGFPFHIDRDIAPGWRERDKAGGRRYHKYAKPLKADVEQPGIQNFGALRQDVVFVVEGWADAIAVEEHGCHAVPLLGASSSALFNWFCSGSDTAVVAMQDNDADPAKGAAKRREMVDRLLSSNVRCVEFPWPAGAPKDAGEWNARDPEGLAKALGEAREAALGVVLPEPESSAPSGGSTADERTSTPAFRGDLKKLVQGETLTSPMVCRWLSDFSGFGDSIAFNGSDEQAWKIGPLPWDASGTDRPLRKQDMSGIIGVIADLTGREINPKCLEHALDQFGAADGHRFNPVRDAIESLPEVVNNIAGGLNVAERGGEPYGVEPLALNPAALGTVRDDGAGGIELTHDGGATWEPMTRVAGHVLARYLGVPATPYSYEVERRLFGGIVARGLYPGCDFQYMPILYGAQGVGKDTFLAGCALDDRLFTTLAGKLEAENIGKVGPGHLVVDVQELDGLKRASTVEGIKSLVSARKDWRHVMYVGDFEVERSFVIVGSTNDRNILADPTGNRRFLILECGATGLLGDAEREEMLRMTRVAIAEIKALHDRIGKGAFLAWLRLPAYVSEEMAEVQAGFEQADVVGDSINAWLDNGRPDRVCVRMVLEEALDIPADRSRNQPKSLVNAVAKALDARPDYKRAQQQRLPKYGRQQAWAAIRR